MTHITTMIAMKPKTCRTTAEPSRNGSWPIMTVLNMMAQNVKAMVSKDPCQLW